MLTESFQAQLSLTTVGAGNPTIGRQERCTASRTALGVITVIVSEAIATDDADIACTIGLAAGATVNITKGADDFTWLIRTFTVTAGALAASDVAGSLVNLTLKRVDPA